MHTRGVQYDGVPRPVHFRVLGWRLRALLPGALLGGPHWLPLWPLRPRLDARYLHRVLFEVPAAVECQPPACGDCVRVVGERSNVHVLRGLAGILRGQWPPARSHSHGSTWSGGEGGRVFQLVAMEHLGTICGVVVSQSKSPPKTVQTRREALKTCYRSDPKNSCVHRCSCARR